MVATSISSADEFLTADELAVRLRKSRVSIYRDARSGAIPSIKIGRSIRFVWSIVAAALVAGSASST
jgi:excisionase family DNA binding protein